MAQADFDYDVFLSHSTHDKPIVREIADFLASKGVRVWFDDWQIRPGDFIPDAIQKGLMRSRLCVLAMSAAAFTSEWVTMERQSAIFKDPMNRDRRFVPVRLDQSELPETLRPYKYIDCSKRSPAEFQVLLDFILSHDQTTVPDNSGNPAVTDRKPGSRSEQDLQEPLRSIRQMIVSRIGNRIEQLKVIHDNLNEVLFRASDRDLRREITIKVPNLPVFEAEEMAWEFYKKMVQASQLNHRNIQQIHAGFRADHLPIMVMGFIKGVSISQLIRKTGAQPLSKIRKVLQTVGNALDYGHRKGAVHQRLRATNILIDDEGEPVVTPMRFAARLDRFQFDGRGTVTDRESDSYIAPEHFFYSDPGSSDQYSLGLIAYEMLLGQNAIDAQSAASFAASKKAFSLTLPDSLACNRRNAQGLLKVIRKMLEFNPERRYPNMEAMVQDVEKLNPTIKLNKFLGEALRSFRHCRSSPMFFHTLYKNLFANRTIRGLFDQRNFKHDSPEEQHWMLREALDLLLGYAEECDADREQDPKRINILSMVATNHAAYGVTPEMYDEFVNALIDAVQTHDPECRTAETKPNNRIEKAWRNAIGPGIAYLKKIAISSKQKGDAEQIA